jgi:drug/metabolite transporter (DMT)-like permease
MLACMTPTAPPPPQLHWALVLLLTVVTLGIFYLLWIIVQARWVKRIDPESQALSLQVIFIVLSIVGQVVIEASDKGSGGAVMGGLLTLGGTVAGVVGFFSQRRTMLSYYQQRLPQGLRLSPALTFFLGPFYLQHHMTRIAKQQHKA